MSHFNQKEKSFKKIVSDLSFEVDTDDVWSSIEEILPREESKKRFFGLWIWGILGLVCISSLSLYTFSNSPDDNTLANNSSTSSIQLTKDIAQQSQSEERASSVTNSDSKKTSIIPTNAISENSNKNITSKIISKPDNINELNLASQSITSNFTSIQNPLLSKTGISSIFDSSLLLSNGEKSNSTNSRRLDTQTSSSALLAAFSKPQIPTLYGTPNLTHELSVINRNILHQRNLNERIQPLNNNHWSPFYALSIGANKSINKYSSLDNTTLPNVQKEQAVFGLSSSLSIGMENSKGWRLIGGLAHHYVVNRYNNQDIDIAQESIHGVNRVIDKQGNTNEIAGELRQTTITNNDISWHNAHNNIDIYAAVGKTWFKRSGWNLSTDVALSYNLISKAQGYYLNDNGIGITKFTAGENHVYKSHKGLGTQLSMNLEKRIGDHWAIQISPTYNHYFNYIYKPLHSLNAKNSQVGLQFGITYRPVWE